MRGEFNSGKAQKRRVLRLVQGQRPVDRSGLGRGGPAGALECVEQRRAGYLERSAHRGFVNAGAERR